VHDIPDVSTRIAALRTKKIDFLDEMALDQSRVLARTNPEIQQAKVPFISSTGVDLRVDHKPFTDIRIRKALQISIDRKKIAEQYYGGTVDGIPCGWVNPIQKGYNFPYEDWPKTLKDEYSYNPEKAKQLLAEAGYPNGFKTNIVTSSDHDVQLLQVIKAYFNEIGVDMEIIEMDPAAAQHFIQSGKQDQMSWDRNTGSTATPTTMVRMNYSTALTNSSKVNDSTYDELCNKLITSISMDEARELTVKLDRYIIENHWAVRLFPISLYNIWNPYIKGYSGENMLRMGSPGGWFWARLWIEPE
jgi:peptide/nickel transport system substrate-binding protein